MEVAAILAWGRILQTESSRSNDSGGEPPLGGSQPSRFERLLYFKPPALLEVSDSKL